MQSQSAVAPATVQPHRCQPAQTELLLPGRAGHQPGKVPCEPCGSTTFAATSALGHRPVSACRTSQRAGASGTWANGRSTTSASSASNRRLRKARADLRGPDSVGVNVRRLDRRRRRCRPCRGARRARAGCARRPELARGARERDSPRGVRRSAGIGRAAPNAAPSSDERRRPTRSVRAGHRGHRPRLRCDAVRRPGGSRDRARPRRARPVGQKQGMAVAARHRVPPQMR